MVAAQHRTGKRQISTNKKTCTVFYVMTVMFGNRTTRYLLFTFLNYHILYVDYEL